MVSLGSTGGSRVIIKIRDTLEAMELETRPLEVTGTVIHFNRGAAFFQFPAAAVGDEEGGTDPATCLFRPNRLLVGGRRPTTGQLKTVETIRQFLSVGDTVTGLVMPRTGDRPFLVTTDNQVPVRVKSTFHR